MSSTDKTREQLIRDSDELAVLRQWRSDLIEPAELLRIVAENAEEALFLYSMEGKVIYVNSAFETITGYTIQELYEQNFIPFIHPDDQAWTQALWEGMLNGEFFDAAEYRILRKDGEIRWNISSWKIVHDNEGRQIGIQGRQHDITDRKVLEEKLIQSSKLASLGEMAAGIAHEMNQPLQVISTIVESHMESSKRGVPNSIDDSLLEILSEQVEKMGSITAQLRTFGRDVSKDKYQENDIHQIIQAMLALFQIQLNNREIDVQVDFGEVSLVTCNYMQIQQVLLNLASNASDAMNATEIKIIRIRTYQADGKVMIEFQDTGPGIPEDLRTKVFDPFFSAKEIGQGSGLGLSISYGIMKEHGGDIVIKESSNSGTTFLLELPL